MSNSIDPEVVVKAELFKDGFPDGFEIVKFCGKHILWPIFDKNAEVSDGTELILQSAETPAGAWCCSFRIDTIKPSELSEVAGRIKTALGRFAVKQGWIFVKAGGIYPGNLQCVEAWCA